MRRRLEEDLFAELTDGMKKKRSSNESFWLVGQSDVTLRKIHRGQETALRGLNVHGFDRRIARDGSSNLEHTRD